MYLVLSPTEVLNPYLCVDISIVIAATFLAYLMTVLISFSLVSGGSGRLYWRKKRIVYFRRKFQNKSLNYKIKYLLCFICKNKKIVLY